MQTILGANGVIANNLAKHLTNYTNQIRLVSRNPRKINSNDELMQANLLNPVETDSAISGSTIVYLTVGIPYRIALWEKNWPIIMQNVIDGCEKHNAKLVFFSNVYPYGKVDGWMTEETPVNPCSRKGEVRARIEEMLLKQVSNGNIKAQIVRAADFYGPQTPLSYLKIMVFDNLAKGKKAQWMITDTTRHSFTYTPDAGKATALLGNTETAYNQVWHVPTDRNVPTGKEFIEMAAKAFGTKPDYMILKKWMMQSFGFFNGDVKEMIEMLYQCDRDYLFDSNKFEKAFNILPVTYQEGLQEVTRSYQ